MRGGEEAVQSLHTLFCRSLAANEVPGFRGLWVGTEVGGEGGRFINSVAGWTNLG